MKRVISLIILIAMVASLATGLAVTSFAGSCDYVIINGKTYTSSLFMTDTDDGNGTIVFVGAQLRVKGDTIWTNTDISATDFTIDLDGHHLTISGTDANNLINCNGNLTIIDNSAGKTGLLEIIASDSTSYGIYADGNIEITGGNLIINAYGTGFNGIYAGNGLNINNSHITINGVDDGKAIDGDEGIFQ